MTIASRESKPPKISTVRAARLWASPFHSRPSMAGHDLT
jgi:hypothetical protein